MILRRASIQSGPSKTRHRALFLPLVLALAVGALGCTVRHRSALPWPDASTLPTARMATAGIRDAESGELDPSASLRLAEASGLVDVGRALSREDRARLLSEPIRLASAADWRRALGERIGHRHVLIGERTESRIDRWNEWLAFIWAAPPIAVPFWRRSDVPHPAFALRVVDLETGRIEAEFFAMMSAKAVQRGLSAAQLEAALRAMGLAKEPR